MFAVIMCGGSGTRFWPASRRQRPKQFLDITGKGAMVVDTCDRLTSLIADDRVILILGKDHREEASELFKGRSVHILAEPVGRNTAPCMGLGALYARHLGSEAPVAFLPADDRNKVIEQMSFEVFTPHTISSPRASMRSS